MADYTLHLNASDGTWGVPFAGPGRVLFDMGSDLGEVDIDNVGVFMGHVGDADLTGTPVADPIGADTVLIQVLIQALIQVQTLILLLIQLLRRSSSSQTEVLMVTLDGRVTH